MPYSTSYLLANHFPDEQGGSYAWLLESVPNPRLHICSRQLLRDEIKRKASLLVHNVGGLHICLHSHRHASRLFDHLDRTRQDLTSKHKQRSEGPS